MRITVVGCGRMGRERALAAAAFGVDRISLYDPDVERADGLAREVPGGRVLRAEQEIDLSTCDALFVCTPPFARGPLEAAAVRAGVPLFLEKPVGLSVEQCLPVLEALEESPVPTAVGYMNRYRASVEHARERLRELPVLGFSASWVCGRYGVPWWGDRTLSGGPLNEQMTHMVDLARFLVDEVTHVQATGAARSTPGGELDTAAVTLRMANGGSGTLLYSCGAREKSIGFQAYTPDETIRLDGWDLRSPDGAVPADADPSDRSAIFRTEVSAFLSAVRSGRTELIRCSFADAVGTQAVVDAVGRALQHGGTEAVRPVPAPRTHV